MHRGATMPIVPSSTSPTRSGFDGYFAVRSEATQWGTKKGRKCRDGSCVWQTLWNRRMPRNHQPGVAYLYMLWCQMVQTLAAISLQQVLVRENLHAKKDIDLPPVQFMMRVSNCNFFWFSVNWSSNEDLKFKPSPTPTYSHMCKFRLNSIQQLEYLRCDV